MMWLFEPDHGSELNTDLDAAQPGLFDSDDDMATRDLPKFVRGHQTYGDAEFFCRKACRLLRLGRYSSYDLRAKVSQISTYCDDSTAGRIDQLMVATGVGHPYSFPWEEKQYRAAGVPSSSGLPGIAEIPHRRAATLQDFSDWFIETFSMQDVVKAAKRRLNSTWGQTDLLDTHFDQLRRDVARIGGSLTDGSQVDNIMESVSPQCVDELSKLGYMGLDTLAKNHSENPVNRHQFDTGIHTIEWFQQHEPAYISAAQDAGASQYWVGYKGRKLQSHPKRSTKDPKGLGINFVEEESRMKQIEQRQDRLESQITEVKQTQDDTKQEVTTLSSKVVSWQESSDKKQDELQMLRKGGGRQGIKMHRRWRLPGTSDYDVRQWRRAVQF